MSASHRPVARARQELGAPESSTSGNRTLPQRQMATPFGTLQLAATPRGLASSRFLADSEAPTPSAGDDRGEAFLAETTLAETILDQAVVELTAYFTGERVDFEVPLDLGTPGGFGHDVLLAARRIPYGRVATYGEVSASAGAPQAARAAGRALNGNPLCIVIPCHRVVPREGGLGGFAAGVDLKAHLLRFEGVSLL